ncbi:MAG: hypothetical protein ACI9CE_002084 [Flavobacterium sp.]|jgi:hypothetical protein
MKFKNQKNNIVRTFAVVAFMLFPVSLFAATTLTSGTITKIDATSYSGDIKVQLTPRPNIVGLTCPSDFWLILKSDGPNYKQMVASLLTARAADFDVQIGADDTNLTGDFCELSRLIIN